MRIAQFEDKRVSFAVGERAERAVENPFIIDAASPGAGATPDWYQRILFELSSGEPAMPCRNRFLRDVKRVARNVVAYETVRRWMMISRIAAPETGLLALSSASGPRYDDFTFALVDLVCELRLADRFDIGADGNVIRVCEAVKTAAPPELKGAFGRAPCEPVKLIDACIALVDGDERRIRGIIADARKELILATQYGALNSEERQAVRTLAKNDLSVSRAAV